MKNILALVALLLACGTGMIKAQNSLHTLKNFSSNELLGLNFIDNVSLPSVNDVPLINTISYLNTSAIIDNINPVIEIAEPAVNIYSNEFKYAIMMDVEVEALTNQALYSFIDYWYGTRYRMGGTTKKGIDCSAFSGTLLSTIFSFNIPRTAREQYKICERINKDELLAGDLVFFNTRGGVSHVGVYLTNNHFVHSSSSKGVKISSLDDSYYCRKFIGGGRVNQ